MKIAYFDCPTGISGNMMIGALIDAGLSPSYLARELKKLKLKGYKLKISKVKKKGLIATYFEVKILHKEPARKINDIYGIIKKSGLKRSIQERSLLIFKRLFEAERKVHGHGMSHLHESGATDAMIDIVGAAIGLDRLGIKDVYCSALPFGRGRIKSEHGIIANPAPAASVLFKDVPIYKKNIKAELVTPTGAAIMTTLAKSFSDMPKLKLENIGSGAGTYDLPEPNILRLFIGTAGTEYLSDLIVSIETNIDNMNPELYDHVINKLMSEGALDAYITPARMKKKRPGVILTTLADVPRKDRMLKTIFSETTTLGVRTYLVKRDKLERVIKQVKTKYGKVSVKIGRIGDRIINLAPEYEDCVRLSRKSRVPLKLIYDEARSRI